MRRRVALAVSGVFAAAFATLLTAQLALMSVLDTARASAVAAEVAESAFVDAVIDDAVRTAVTPLTGPEIAAEVASVASADRRVRAVVADSLVAAHRQVVDPSAPTGTSGTDVNAVVATVVDDLSSSFGIDLSPVAAQVRVPEARPEQLPAVGLRTVASLTRAIASAIALVAAAVCIAVHPRPMLGVSVIGARVAWVCGVWVVVLLAIGWLIGWLASTLFGQLLDAIWSSAAPALIGLVAGGLLLGIGTWLGARSVDGLLGGRRPPRPPPPPTPPPWQGPVRL